MLMYDLITNNDERSIDDLQELDRLEINLTVAKARKRSDPPIKNEGEENVSLFTHCLIASDRTVGGVRTLRK
jgi:hypothetical protein